VHAKQDVAARRELYMAALDVLLRMASHPLLGLGLMRAVEGEAEEDDEGAASSSGKADADLKPAAAAPTAVEGDRGAPAAPQHGSLANLLERLAASAKYYQKCGGQEHVQTSISREEEGNYVRVSVCTHTGTSPCGCGCGCGLLCGKLLALPTPASG
jgi:type IV secretory pathway TrbL component